MVKAKMRQCENQDATILQYLMLQLGNQDATILQSYSLMVKAKMRHY